MSSSRLFPSLPFRVAGAFGVLVAALLLLSCDLTDDKGKRADPPGPVDTTGDTSSTSARRPPGAPSEVLAIAGDRQAMVSWTAPEYDSGAVVATYRAEAVEDSARACVAKAPLTACTVTGLSNKATYTFVVRAENRAGAGEPSSPSLTVVPLPPALPAPTGVSAVAGGGTATVTWTAPGPGTWVSVYASQDLSKTCGSDGDSKCVIRGLEFGKAYTFVARAFSEVGAGAPSAPTAPVFSLPTIPGAPFTASAAAGDTQATVSWTPPANNGGDSIVGYEVSAVNGTGVSCSTGPLARSCVVGKLPANVSVSFRVRAINALGPGASKTTGSVTPFYTEKLPGRPSITSAVVGNGKVTLSWTGPSAGGSPITGYRVYTVNSPARCTTSTLSCTVEGLTNGVVYTFTVVAENAYGAGPASFSAKAAPTALPSAPTSFVATPGNGQVALSWQPPASQGAGPVTGYRATIGQLLPGCTTAGALSCTITGLTNGTFYIFEVHAVNDSGEGVAASANTVPFGPPGPPLNVVGNGAVGSASVFVTWTAPASNGGSAITRYAARAVEDSSRQCVTSTGTATGCTVNGLTVGVPYTFVVKAANAAGEGPASAPSAPATPTP